MEQFIDRLLLDDRPLLVDPKLATLIGLNESIFLQQLHYWLRGSGAHQHNGRMWVYNTYAEWQEQFPFWTESGIRGIVRRLEGKANEGDPKLIISTDEFNKMTMDRTKWYTIDYDALAKFRLSKSTDGASCDNASMRYEETPHELLVHNASDHRVTTSAETNTLKSLQNDADEPVNRRSFQDQVRRETRGVKPARKRARDLTGFDEWYQAYPLHQNRDEAEIEWDRLTAADRAAALTAIRQQVTWQSMQREAQYIPRPHTWLKNRRWLDEPPPLAPTGVMPPEIKALPWNNATRMKWEFEHANGARL